MSNNLVSMENLDAIMKAVRLGIIQKIDAKDITAEQKAILTKADLIDVVTNNGKFLADNGTYMAIDTAKINDVNTKTKNVMDLFKINYSNDTGTCEVLSPSLPTPAEHFGCIEYNSKIYCIGGVYSNKVQIYDIINNTWTTGADKPTASNDFGCVEYKGKIYCLAGYNYDLGGLLKVVEIYDIANNIWSTGADVPSICNSPISFIYNDKIYIIGNITQIYDIANNTWTTGAANPASIYGFSGSLYSGKIYCIGGNNTNKLQIYDIISNTWTTGADMLSPKESTRSVLSNDNIYTIGGRFYNTWYNNIEIYNITSNSWTTISTVMSARSDFGCVLYKGKAYCLDGDNANATVSKFETITIPYTNYTFVLPADLQAKLDLIPDVPGDGTKVLADNGQWIDVPLGYRFMSDVEVTNEVSIINNYIG